MNKQIALTRTWPLGAALVAVTVSSVLAACGGHSSAVPTPQAHGAGAKAQPHATETPPPLSAYLPDTWDGIHVFQPFDNFDNKPGYVISEAQAAADGPLYDAIWGSNSGKMVKAWKTNHRSILTTYYLPIGLDALAEQFGNKGHKLGWWNKNHPDWVLYECDQTTVAYVPGVPEVPLDISNPDVITYLENLVGTYAEGHGYAALGADFAVLGNPTGGNNGGTRGCGVWTQNHTVWVQKFAGTQTDPAYASAVLNWMASFRTYLHGLPRPLALWGNTVPGSVTFGDPQQTQITADLDVVADEAGDARFGHFADDAYFNNRVKWAVYAQSIGKGYLEIGLWHETELTNAEIDYAIASYLMSKEQASLMAAFPYGFYGQEHYYQAYQSAIGTPCAEMYGGPSYNGQKVYYRKYSGGLSVLNTSGSNTYSVTLPQSTYTDAVSGATVTSPLSVPPFSGFVLLAANGCS